ncbi:MAG: TetR/AcrR family transcriptional regulator [Acidimicrobiales bacterium]|nr:TetR family transcriptional regulator [Acidimicrobiales bacterium]
MTFETKPTGRQAVEEALLAATIEMVVAKGLNVSVREIAANAGVNHGLVHTYFGSKQGLIDAALDQIGRRSASQLRCDGYPRPDLANLDHGLLAKALARFGLDMGDRPDPLPSHPVFVSWKAALGRDNPDLDAEGVDEKVALAASLALGWAMYHEFVCAALDIDDVARKSLEERVCDLVAELGGIPG